MALTRAEWFASTEPDVLLRHVRQVWTLRRKQLCLCGCCRLLGPPVLADSLRRWVEVAEEVADGNVEEEALAAEVVAARKARSMAPLGTPWEWAPTLLLTVAHEQPDPWGFSRVFEEMQRTLGADASRRVCGLIRDLHDPSGLPGPEAAWLRTNDGAAVRLAQGIYQRRASDELPVLADVLEDVGCLNPEILDHCRAPGEHFRGCWVLDLLLLRG
jgi:hypothetical protein